ncbi:hypothetical protein CYY_007133 [Polysphondylium violaceum]|uniref:FNIP repeat-containing protein n=1 Tax=Polysphondylium violaceum TaxID=133409 RepID=A0A8J4PY38_9MYCE|nr:hypothetical protein CYY_007133 [Polysphondylium violaceum]
MQSNNKTPQISIKDSGVDLFYSIFRNSFLKRVLINKVLENSIIVITNDDIISNSNNSKYKYLSNISAIEKLENNISIRFLINDLQQFKQYLNSIFKYVINDLKFGDGFDVSVTSTVNQEPGQQLIQFDFNLLHQDLHRLSFSIMDGAKFGDDIDNDDSCIITLPPSLTELNMQESYRYRFYEGIYRSHSYDRFLSNLPQSIKKLTLPYKYVIGLDKLVLPNSLCYFNYQPRDINNLKKLVMPTRKNLPLSCLCFDNIFIKRTQDLEWIRNHSWFTTLNFAVEDNDNEGVIKANVIPPNIEHLNANKYLIEQGSLPQTLVSLSLNGDHPLSNGIFPSGLHVLHIHHLHQELIKHLLPESLEILTIQRCSKPIPPNTLPSNLLNLDLRIYEFNFTVGLFPSSLTQLSVTKYNNSLDPFVLPQCLKKLKIIQFNNQLVANSLPPSLTKLKIPEYDRSFDLLSPLPNLKSIEVYKLNESIVELISNNIQDLKISFNRMDYNVSLYHTSINRLFLKSNSSLKSNLYARLLPQSLVKLKIIHIIIEPNMNSILPNSCVYLETDFINLNLDLLPKSIKYLNKKFIK